MKSKILGEYINEYFLKKGQDPWKLDMKKLDNKQLNILLKDIKKIID